MGLPAPEALKSHGFLIQSQEISLVGLLKETQQSLTLKAKSTRWQLARFAAESVTVLPK
jgi:hypothetical protein